MALANPNQSYWAFAFVAVSLNPIGCDALFLVANLIIISVFPRDTQGLVGVVFNTVAQIGRSLGLAVIALVADSVIARSSVEDKGSAEALMEGYRAAFWLMFAMCAASLFANQ